MIKFRMKNYNTKLREKQQKYQVYHQEKFYKSEYLMGEEILPSNKSRIIEQARFTYSEQGKKEIDAITNQNKELEALTI